MTTPLPNTRVSPLRQKLIDDMNMPRPPRMSASFSWPRVKPAFRCPP